MRRSTVLPFALERPGETAPDGRTLARSYQVRGTARLEGDRLTLEWSGSIEIREKRAGSVRTLRESVPAQRLVLPVARIASIELRRRWFRPYVELCTAGARPLDLVPTAADGRVLLRLARRDRRAAAELVSHVRQEMADLALRDAESSRKRPRAPSRD